MEGEIEIVETQIPWYSRIFWCFINRNRISPEKVELTDCDFFIVEPTRTLRILRPIQNNDEYYELSSSDRSESINENFISRWTKRPHSLNKCRCSFRQSLPRNSPECEFISAEINRIRTSLCEAEKIGQNIDELEKRLSLNINCINDSIAIEQNKKYDEKFVSTSNTIMTIDNYNDKVMNKNKIIKELEKYIDELLKEVLNDTMKFINDVDDTLYKSRKTLDKQIDNNFNATNDGSLNSPLNISFAFLPDYQIDKNDLEAEVEMINTAEHSGYVNHAFIGTIHDPDCLDFDLRKPLDNNKHLDKVDCVDSGINSVETMEFPLESELSLEQSLMKIIDAKFGRVPLSYSWENLNSQDNIVDNDNVDDNKNIESNVTINEKEDIDLITSLNKDDTKYEVRMTNEVVNNKSHDIDELDTPMMENKFDELKLELKNDSKISSSNDESVKKLNSVAVLCEKLTFKLSKKSNNSSINHDDNKNNEKSNLEYKKKRKFEGIEMEDYRATWNGCKESKSSPCDNQSTSPNDLTIYRRNRKPIIVFLHGFGSSAEVFEYQLQYFSSMGYPCIAPEMLGHGMSSAPDRRRDYRFDKLLNDIEAVLHHYAFKPGRKCVLVAHNYGCSFATALATKYENEIRQLVLISGGGPTPLAPPATEGAGQCCLRLFLTPLLVCGLRRDLLYSARGRQHPYCGPEADDQWPSHMKYILNGMIWPEGDYIFHRRIGTPTLLIHGLRDNKVSLVQECQMERTILKAFLEAIPTAGHIPMTDTPEQVNHMIHCFIDLWKKKKW